MSLINDPIMDIAYEVGKEYGLTKEFVHHCLIVMDGLTKSELEDKEYIEDRLDTHLEFWTLADFEAIHPDKRGEML